LAQSLPLCVTSYTFLNLRSRRENPQHTQGTAYRCLVPHLTRFAGSSCAGPGRQRLRAERKIDFRSAEKPAAGMISHSLGLYYIIILKTIQLFFSNSRI